MSKVAEYLQDHITGEVVVAPEILEHFSTDASIFKIIPQIIEYPRVEDDIRKTARFTWQLAERGKVIPITARGLGTDQGGAAIGSGIVMIFPAHMNKVLSLNAKKGLVTVQPGVNYGRLEQALQTHGQFIPPYPTSVEYSTIGGAICNNAGGEKTLKYGSTKDYVRSLRVVLANGDLITTSRLSKRELNKKKSQSDMEGEIYRAVDGLICDNTKLLDDNRIYINNNNAGYDLWRVKQPDGSFDLTPLFVGSQGTLGIVSEATLETEPYNPQSNLIVGFFDNIENAGEAINKIRKLQPCSLEIVDGNLLALVEKTNPNQLKRSEKPFDKLVLFVEFDDYKDRHQKKNIKKTKKILEQLARSFQYAADREEQEELWKIRHSASNIISHSVGNKRALPIIEDGSVPPERFTELLQKVYELFEHFGLDVAVWGHAGTANLHVRPFLDLDHAGDRQSLFLIMDAYYKMILEMGGTTSGEHNDGRLKGPYLRQVYGEELYVLFKNVKQAFDPYGTLNPCVKIDVTKNDLQPIIRREYSLKHLSAHMPRT